MNFISYLNTLISVSEPLKQRIRSVYRPVSVEKGELLIKKGERCRNLYFIEEGLLRGFYFHDEKEITSWFAREGEFATSFYSFISGDTSFESIQALEDCKLLQIPAVELQKLYVEFPETERIGRILTETYYIKLESRLIGIQFKSAKERYENLIQNHPVLLERAALGYIASYLGITQETLSRIRAGK